MLDATMEHTFDRATDQASGLRQLFNTQMLGVLPVCGSWQLVELLARALAIQSRVAVLDEQDTAVMNAFHKSAEYELADLLSGYREFQEVAVRVNDRLSLLSAQTGLQKFLRYASENQLSGESLFSGFMSLSKPFRWLLINSIQLRSAAELVRGQGEVLLVIPDTPEGIKQAYSQIKEAAVDLPDMQLRIAIQSESESQAQKVFRRLAETSERFLRVRPQLALRLPFEWQVSTGMAEKWRVAMSAWKLAEYVQTEQRTDQDRT